MLVLLPLGAVFLTVSMTEITIASNEVDAAKGFNIAEAGLELAKRTMKMSTARSLNVFLTGTNPGPYPFGSTPGAGNSLDGGNYIVRIYDNNDGDGDPLNDTDDIVFIESTGSFESAHRRIVALVQIPLVPDPDGAVEVPTAVETEIELEKGAWIDGRDWVPPPDPSTCVVIASCGSFGSNPDLAGVSANSVTVEVAADADSQLFGSPPTQLNPSLSVSTWDRLIDQMVPLADRTLTVGEKLFGTHTWGTSSAPEITVITADKTEIESGAVVNGAGLLIIDGIGELELDHGTLNWQGLILLRGLSELEVEFQNDNDATQRIFGGVVLATTGPTPEIELEIENTQSFIKYSRSALDMVRASLRVRVLRWHEVPM